MAKSDGRRIVIEFDLPLVGDPSGNADKFTVTVPTLPYGYGGSTAEETCTVTAVEPYTSISEAVDLSGGTLSDTVYSGGRVELRGGIQRLPDAYTEVEYIELGSSCTIDAGFVPKYQSSFVLKHSYTKSSASNVYSLYTASTSASPRYNFGIGSLGLFYINNSSGSAQGFSSLTLNPNWAPNNLSVTVDRANSIITAVSNGVVYTAQMSAPNREPSANLKFRNAGYSWRLYSFEYNDATKQQQLVPCYRISDQKAGLYDLTSQAFLTNSAGTLTHGQEYTPVHTSSGTAVYVLPLTHIGSYVASELSWTSETPSGTSVTVEVGIGTSLPVTWTSCTNGEEIPGFTPTGDYSDKNLYLRVTLETEDTLITPALTGITVQLRDAADANRIVLVLGNGNRTNLQKAANGEVYIRYANGDLSGEDMPVENFLESFTPEDVAYKGNQNPHEHLEITGASYTGTLRKIEYASAQDDRNSHLAITGATYTGVLTYIEPI